MQQTAHSSTSELAIRGVLEARSAALKAKNAEDFVAHYATDVVTYDLAPPLQNLGPDVRDTAGWEAWFATWDGPIVEDLSAFSVTVAESDDIAFSHGLVNLQGDKIGEGPQSLWFRSTWCLRQIDGTWMITHEHNSTPFYMDGSHRAATDLVP